GRFGSGKTHNLFHLEHWFQSGDSGYQFRTFYARIAPYTEDDPQTRGWSYIHRKILDAMGEHFLRELVRAADQKPGGRERDLSLELQDHLTFGDANLKQSLGYVLANFFLRETRDTSEAWKWLKGQESCHGTTKDLETSSDMINVLLNLGKLCRWALGQPIVLLLDEGQALEEVKKASITQIHDGFLQLAEAENEDVGFVLAIFGTGGRMIPAVLMSPPDILSRLGVTERTLSHAFFDLKGMIRNKDDSRSFMDQVLSNLIDQSRAATLISEFQLPAEVTPDRLPFTEEALDRIAETISQHEDNRNPRMIITTLARLASEAYQRAKAQDRYVVADRAFVEPIVRDF
ncbi:MAG: hypothetical protein ABIH23_04400, partial [bacterium]